MDPDFFKKLFPSSVESLEGANTNNVAGAIARSPLPLITGLGVGAAKGIVSDLPVYGWNALAGLGNIVQGKDPNDEFIRKYEEGARNLAIAPANFISNAMRGMVGLDPVEANSQDALRSAEAGLFTGAMASPNLLHKIPVVNKIPSPIPNVPVGDLLEGGLIGKAGAATASASTVLPKGLASVIRGGEEVSPVVKYPNIKGEKMEGLANFLNPKSTTNYIGDYDPNIFAELQSRYDAPISNLKDLTGPLGKKYADYERDKKFLGLRPNKQEFINNELKNINTSDDAKVLLKDKFNDSLTEYKAAYDPREAKANYERNVARFLDPKDLATKDASSLIGSATNLAKNHFEELKRLQLEGAPQEKLLKADETFQATKAKIYDDFAKLPEGENLKGLFDESFSINKLADTQGELNNLITTKPIPTFQKLQPLTGEPISSVPELARNLFQKYDILDDATKSTVSFEKYLGNNLKSLNLPPQEASKLKVGISDFLDDYQKIQNKDQIVANYENAMDKIREGVKVPPEKLINSATEYLLVQNAESELVKFANPEQYAQLQQNLLRTRTSIIDELSALDPSENLVNGFVGKADRLLDARNQAANDLHVMVNTPPLSIAEQASSIYKRPITNIDELTNASYNKFQQKLSLAKEKGLNVDSNRFINSEVASFAASPQEKQALKSYLQDKFSWYKSSYDPEEAAKSYNRSLNRFQLKTYKQEASPTELLNSAKNYTVSKFNQIRDYDFYENSKLAETASVDMNALKEKIVGDLTKIDPDGSKGLVGEYLSSFDSGMISKLNRFSNFFKVEPAFGDMYQVGVSYPSVVLNNAYKLGVDPAKYVGGGFKWSQEHSQLIKSQILDYYKTLQDTLESTRLESSKAGKFAKPMNSVLSAFNDFAFAAQSGPRETMIKHVFVPEAYGQIKKWAEKTGKIVEGTPEFNRAVINHTIQIMRDTGMVPDESKYLFKKAGEVKIGKHLDDMVRDWKAEGNISKEIKSASMFMNTWVKPAAQAFLKSYNDVANAFRLKEKYGAWTPRSTVLFWNGATNMAVGATLFGLRGLRVPIAINEFSLASSPNPSSVPDTAATLAFDNIARFLNFDSDFRQRTKEGIMGSLAGGATFFRQLMIPFLGYSQGLPIALASGQKVTSSGLSSFKNLIDGMMTAWAQGDINEMRIGAQKALEDAMNPLIPKDVNSIVTSHVDNLALDPTGRNYLSNIDPTAPFQKMDIVSKNLPLLKGLPADYEGKQGVSYGEADTRIIQKYSRYKTVDDFSKPEVFDKFLDEVETIYSDSEKIKKIAETIIDNIEDVGKPRVYTGFKKYVGDFATINPEVLKDDPIIEGLSEHDAVVICANSILYEKEKKSANVLLLAGKIPLDPDKQDEFFDKVAEERDKIELRKERKREE